MSGRPQRSKVRSTFLSSMSARSLTRRAHSKPILSRHHLLHGDVHQKTVANTLLGRHNFVANREAGDGKLGKCKRHKRTGPLHRVTMQRHGNQDGLNEVAPDRTKKLTATAVSITCSLSLVTSMRKLSMSARKPSLLQNLHNSSRLAALGSRHLPICHKSFTGVVWLSTGGELLATILPPLEINELRTRASAKYAALFFSHSRRHRRPDSKPCLSAHCTRMTKTFKKTVTSSAQDKN